MADNVTAQMVEAINQAQLATLSPSVVRASGAGKAYQSVAQSGAIAVQDATDYLRNVQTMVTTATGLALAQMFAGKPEPAATIITTAQTALTNGIASFASICAAAAAMLRSFPSG